MFILQSEFIVSYFFPLAKAGFVLTGTFRYNVGMKKIACFFHKTELAGGVLFSALYAFSDPARRSCIDEFVLGRQRSGLPAVDFYMGREQGRWCLGR